MTFDATAQYFIGVVLARFVLSIVPAFGAFLDHERACAHRGTALDEAKAYRSSANSQMLLVTWPLIAFVAIAMKARSVCSAGIDPLWAIAGLVVAGLAIFLSGRFPTSRLRGWRPYFVLVAVTALDILLYAFLLDDIADCICHTGA